jgi:hypothetical protein
MLTIWAVTDVVVAKPTDPLVPKPTDPNAVNRVSAIADAIPKEISFIDPSVHLFDGAGTEGVGAQV